MLFLIYLNIEHTIVISSTHFLHCYVKINVFYIKLTFSCLIRNWLDLLNFSNGHILQQISRIDGNCMWCILVYTCKLPYSFPEKDIKIPAPSDGSVYKLFWSRIEAHIDLNFQPCFSLEKKYEKSCLTRHSWNKFHIQET